MKARLYEDEFLLLRVTRISGKDGFFGGLQKGGVSVYLLGKVVGLVVYRSLPAWTMRDTISVSARVL